MKKYVLAVLLAAFLAPCAHADHKHGPRNECWRDSKYNKHWAYYYCGVQQAKCDDKKSKGHDTVFWQYHGDGFTFRTSPTETYWCCNGSTTAKGEYVRSDTWIVEQQTERVSLGNGSCNKLIQKDVCGNESVVECDTPDSCNAGFILRNNECVAPCGDNEVFMNPTSNTCIPCETTNYQGIGPMTMEVKRGKFKKHTKTIEYQGCIKCDMDTEFFNRQTKKCVKKEGLTMLSKAAMNACWRCPVDLLMDCAREMEKPSAQRGAEIDNWAEIKQECKIKE